MAETNNFDRQGDWKNFCIHMQEYIEMPVKKYGGKQQFNDLLHYTGLRVMLWNILKYALRLWLGNAKRNDFEKIAHYAQMAWTLKEQRGLQAPFVNVDSDEEYILVRKTKT